MFSFVRVFTVLAIALVIGLAVIAQEDRPNQPPDRAASAQKGKQADAQLATCLVIDNQNEIALAEFASQRSENPQVKQFAQQMIEEHTQFLEKLQKFAATGQRYDRDPATRDRDPSERDTPNKKDRDPNDPAGNDDTERRDDPNTAADERIARDEPRAGRRGGRHQGGIDFLSLKRELAAQCLESTRTELEKKEGAEFDQCYMTQQLMAHMHMNDALTVFQKHASDELRQVLAQGQDTTQKHLAHAKKIYEQLDSKSTVSKVGDSE